MKNKKQVYFTLLASLAISAAIILLVRKGKQQKRSRLAVISDAGYETAHDIHFPIKINRLKKQRPL